MADAKTPRYFLDIGQEVCPFTFVRTRLQLERMRPGEVVEVRLRAGEPLLNVPRAAEELGHTVLRSWPEDESRPDGLHRLWIEKH